MGDGLVRGVAQWSQATSSEQIMKARAFLLQSFNQDQVGRMAGETLELILEQTPQDASTKKLSDSLSRIGDELHSKMELRMIAAMDTDLLPPPPPPTHTQRSSSVWQLTCLLMATSVAALFYFASKLMLKVLCKESKLLRTTMD